MREARIPVPAPCHDAPGHAHFRPLIDASQRGDRRCGGVRPLEGVRVRRDAARYQRVVFLAPRLEDEVQLVGRHALFAPAEFARLRYASMNGSIAPSITFATSEILSSVRWSFTMVYGWNT